ncbi:portal protein [Maritalea porphyrae]|uniref:portal protein n=1 Tax=Maritalea porphyrae TaxID=880732 RepID=UPI0022AEAF23|nr:portal protein [Maritalea porphyrae]MCZ4270897.1 portal protein [Maritalea porphyrae]
MTKDRSKGEERDLLQEGRDELAIAVEYEGPNRLTAEDDTEFARLGKQWPEDIRKERERDRRPCLTRNMMNSFIRQVVNDARQNKPSIKVHPADDKADVETADIYNGLIRNIEYTSDAEIAYDTATENAVSMGWGYFKIEYDRAYDDSDDLDIGIRRVANPFSIYGDPYSTAADSSDWNSAFEVEWLTEDAFEKQFPNEEKIDFDFDFEGAEDWKRDKEILVAKWWRREEVDRPMVVLSNGQSIDKSVYEAEASLLSLDGIYPVREYVGRSHKVKRHILTGAKVVKSEDWLGQYIPIVPVYGDEVVDANGKRHFRSLICDAKDTQRQYNYWQSAATELVALAPKVPYIGPLGSFKSDGKRWATANTANHPYLEYDVVPNANGDKPQRQPLDSGPAAGALQQAMTAREDMQAIIGLHDPSMGQVTGDQSGIAVHRLQRRGDVSTFHFQDNMARAIRHAGRIVIDLIPKVYNSERVIRIMGEDGAPKNVPLKRPVPAKDENGKPIMQPKVDQNGNPVIGDDGTPLKEQVERIYDLGIGKFDLTVTTGPSFTTKREEAAVQMMKFIDRNPASAPLIGDLVAKNLDWPGADEFAKRFKKMLPPQLQEGGLPPEITQLIEQGKQTIAGQNETIAQLQAYVLKLESDRTNNARKVDVDEFKAETDRYEADTDRMEALSKMGQQAPKVTPPVHAGMNAVDQARANSLNASAALARARAIKEMQPEPQPYEQGLDPRFAPPADDQF